MFGWFRATCPVDPAAKDWIEERLEWLNAEFPTSALNDKSVVLPTAEFFPDAYDGSKRSVRRLLDRVCGQMGVAPNLVAMKVFSQRGELWLVNEQGQYVPTSAAGLYEEGTHKFIIRLDSSQIGRPMDLVCTMAHELAHVLLLGENRIGHEAFDNELLTDLTAVFHGFGVFLANSPRNWEGQYSNWPATELRKPEYMTPPMYGYALAHLAWHRGETRPKWARYLHMAARANLKQGLRYLRETGDSTFAPQGPR